MSEAFLDEGSAREVRNAVVTAKADGWSPADVKDWFVSRGCDAATYKQAIAGEAISADVRALLIGVSITGLPAKRTKIADVAIIKRHIEWHVAPARGEYDDALIEIAHDDGPGTGVKRAKMFELDDVASAAEFAAEQNARGSNLYIGAALRTPDAAREKRGSQETFYVGLSVPIDIDSDYDETRARMAAVTSSGATVVTGLIPSRRSQHWVRLTEPCDDDIEYGAAFAALVAHTGADRGVKDAARVMRLAGTVNYPSPDKIARGYTTELVGLSIDETAQPMSVEALKALAPGSFEAKWQGQRPGGGNGIERDANGVVVNGRETWFRDELLRCLRQHHSDCGLDPSPQELFDSAWVNFSTPTVVNNSDERWTCAQGKRELLSRAIATLRRLREGRLVGQGLYSRDTLKGQDQAEAHESTWRDAHPQSEDFGIFRQRQAHEQAEAESPADEEKQLFPGLFRASELNGEPPSREWVVKDWIVQGAVNSLYGEGGVGKTLLAQQLACAISIGAPWIGMPTKAGSVLAILCEDDKGELHRRHNAIKSSMGHVIGNPFSDVWLWPRVGDHNILVQWDSRGLATVGAFIKEMEQAVAHTSCSLLILDTLTDFYGGNEVDRAQVNYFVKTVLGGIIKQRSANNPLTVLLLGHPSVAGAASGSGMSGSTAWNGAVRSRMYLEREKDAAPDSRKLTRMKANYASSGEDTAITLMFSEGALVHEPPIPDGDSILWATQNEVVSLVKSAWQRGMPYSQQKGHTRFIYTALTDDLKRGGTPTSLANQAIRSCIDDGKIEPSRAHGKRGWKDVD